MNNLHLKIIHTTGRTGSPSLCNCCAYGLVMRGEGQEHVFCSYIREFVTIRVTDCSRYQTTNTEAQTDTSNELLAQYTLD